MRVTGTASQDSAPLEPGMAAFESAVRSHSRVLWSIAAAVLGRREGAEDAVQEAVIVALGKRDEFPRVENFPAWMAQIVRFVALNKRRSARIRLAEGEETLQHVPARSVREDGGDVIDKKGRMVSGTSAFDDNVMRAINGLDETPRACLLLRVINDMSYKEIGQILEIPEGTAMSHVFRARKAMLQRLGGNAAGPMNA